MLSHYWRLVKRVNAQSLRSPSQLGDLPHSWSRCQSRKLPTRRVRKIVLRGALLEFYFLSKYVRRSADNVIKTTKNNVKITFKIMANSKKCHVILRLLLDSYRPVYIHIEQAVNLILLARYTSFLAYEMQITTVSLTDRQATRLHCFG